MKVDSLGVVQWHKAYDGILNGDKARGGLSNGDGTYILYGITQSNGYPSGGNNIYVVKIDEQGNHIWSAAYGFGVGIDEEPFKAIRCADGGYVLVGSRGSNLAGYAIKINNSGSLQWTRVLSVSYTTMRSVVETSDGSLVIAGTQVSGQNSMYLLKLDKNGNMLWYKSYNGSGQATEVLTSPNGGFFLIGTVAQPAGTADVAVLRVASTGDLTSSRRFDLQAQSNDRVNSALLLNDLVLICGQSSVPGAFAMAVDTSGSFLWANVWGATASDRFDHCIDLGDRFAFSGDFNDPGAGRAALLVSDLGGSSRCPATMQPLNFVHDTSVTHTISILSGMSTPQNFAFGATTLVKNLWNPANTQLCPFVDQIEADFNVNDSLIVEGQSVKFTDASFDSIQSWQWHFPGGSPLNSNDTNPIVTYSSAGEFDVALVVTNKLGSDTLTRSNLISVAPKHIYYYSFPKDSAVWSVEEYFWNNNYPHEPNGCRAEHYGLVGDTVINGQTYSALYANNLVISPGWGTTNPAPVSSFDLSKAQFVGGIREDSMKRVWFVQPGGTEWLYYDFGLNVGDTFCFDYLDYLGANAGCWEVQWTDSTWIDGRYRRAIYFGAGGQTWIEGIGSLIGWFEWETMGSWGWNLLCYREGNKQLYGSNYCHCNTYGGNGVDAPDSIRFKVSPNPARDRLNVSGINGNDAWYELSFVSGQSVSGGNIGTQPIHLPEVSPGVYVLTVGEQNRAQQFMIVISDSR